VTVSFDVHPEQGPGWRCQEDGCEVFVPADGSAPKTHPASLTLRSVVGAMQEWCKADVLKFNGANLAKHLARYRGSRDGSK